MRTPIRIARGFTLIEVMIAAAIFTIGILGFMQSFGFIARAVHSTRGSTIASNLVQAEVETLKNNSYYALQVTTTTKSNTNYTPNLTYSKGAYGEKTVSVAGITFTVASRVDFAAMIGGVMTTMNYTDPDPGMKSITTYVMWKDGKTWKYLSLSNLMENPNVAPQTATITGTVREVTVNTAVKDVQIKTLENPSLAGYSNASGLYSFKVNAGTYTLAASSSNFFFNISTSVYVAAGTTYTKDWYLYRIGTGTVTGSVWQRPYTRTQQGYLISQMVASTVTWVPDLNDYGDVEYVELLNPTTSSVEMSYLVLFNYRHNGGNDNPLKYRYTYGYPWIPDPTWDYMSFRSTYIPPNSYFLVANTSMSFVLHNSTIQADAYYEGYYDYDGTTFSNSTSPYQFPSLYRTNSETSGPQAVYAYSYDPTWTYFLYDELGFTGTTASKYPYLYKTDYPRCNGIEQGEAIIRFSSPAWTSNSAQRAYDTENNRLDFDCNRTGTPRSMTTRAFNVASGTQTAIAGVPSYGAIVSINDTYSGSTIAYQVTITTASGGLSYPAAKYTLVGVSTGTWMVDIGTAGLFAVVSTITVSSSNVTYYAPSTATTNAAYSFSPVLGMYTAPTVLSPVVAAGSLANNTYYYRVTAINGSNFEDNGGNELVTPVNVGHVRFSWSAVSGASSYRVYRGTSPGGQFVYYSTNSACYTDTGAAATNGNPPRVYAINHIMATSTVTATGSSSVGYVSGYVWDVSGVPLSGISVVAGGVPKTTNASGFYAAQVSTGSVQVIVNSGNSNTAYVSDTFNVTVNEGQVTNQNDYLLRGGTLKGYVTSGVSALPNINVNAKLNGTVMGNGTSDSSGYFYIYNLTTGSYTVTPALDPVADASPDDYTSSVAQGVTTFIGTFTVTGAYGTISGTVKKGSNLITTGALILASSVTIPTTPPTVVASSSAAQNLYYAVSSLSDGTYSLLVRGATNYTYYIRAWYPTLSGQTVTVTNVGYSGVSVTPTGSVTQNITVP